MKNNTRRTAKSSDVKGSARGLIGASSSAPFHSTSRVPVHRVSSTPARQASSKHGLDNYDGEQLDDAEPTNVSIRATVEDEDAVDEDENQA